MCWEGKQGEKNCGEGSIGRKWQEKKARGKNDLGRKVEKEMCREEYAG